MGMISPPVLWFVTAHMHTHTCYLFPFPDTEANRALGVWNKKRNDVACMLTTGRVVPVWDGHYVVVRW